MLAPQRRDLSATLARGVVSNIRKEGQKTLIQSDVNVLSGNSGGPLVNGNGEVVGITVSGIQVNKAAQGINFFIPIKDALDSMNIK